MKKRILSACATGLLLTFWACGGSDKQTVETGEAKAVDTAAVAAARELTIDTAASRVLWEGSEGLAKILTSHTGSFNIQSGSLSVKDSQLVAGKFVIDINSIQNFDIKRLDKKADFIGHMKSADFFESAKFPTATFELVSAEKLPSDSVRVTGNLTMKGVTKSVVFPAKVAMTGDGLSANAKFYINRKDWGMNWHSEASLGDELIRPEVGVELKIAAKWWAWGVGRRA